jgi:dGTPase
MTSNRFYGAFDFEQIEPARRAPDDHRTPFQIDRDRIIFSHAFRRLQSKTQVFQSGEYDFYRTRLTHTIEVARIARSIAEYLNARSERLRPDFFIDPDLVEAVGLAHDLGHPPFGHIGERKLNDLMRAHGGFEGNAQTLRILTDLIYPREKSPRGMNSTRAFLDGVLKYKQLHSERTRREAERVRYPENHFLYDDQAHHRQFVLEGNPLEASDQYNALKSIECQIMDWADDTAYSLHDVVDGVHARFITPEILEEWESHQKDLSSLQIQKLSELKDSIREGYFEPQIGRRIGAYIYACSLEKVDTPLADKTNRHRFRLQIDRGIEEECSLFKRLAVDIIFKSTPIQQIEYKGGHLLDALFSAFVAHYLQPQERPLRILPAHVHQWVLESPNNRMRYRLICDFLAAMTDAEAIRLHKRLFDADFGSIVDFV